RGLAHPAEAHLDEKVETVFVERDKTGAIGLQRLFELMLPLGEHGIEQRHRIARAPQIGGGVERRQRRIGLALCALFGVVFQKVRMRQQNIHHNSEHLLLCKTQQWQLKLRRESSEL